MKINTQDELVCIVIILSCHSINIKIEKMFIFLSTIRVYEVFLVTILPKKVFILPKILIFKYNCQLIKFLINIEFY